ncbi:MULTISPECIES: antitoxin Xre/MbcA/ParS toxin-binding domain-containing protein [Aurantimonas]|uniref:antitoxin Xre/MbcA/ParS toxin-binding domain-containing protein n=1 Tax=Aurantimonas TaxID=182269 RepID=UPI003513D93B
MISPQKELYNAGFREIEKIEKDAGNLAVSSPENFTVEHRLIELLLSIGVKREEIERIVFHDRGEGTDHFSGKTLSRTESDRLNRISHIVQIAERVFGSHEKAFFWLRMPNIDLNNQNPMKAIETETGARIVDEILARIDYGIAA